MSFYSPSELKSKAEEIVEEAIAATYREAESYRDALNAQYTQEYHAAGHTGTPPPAMQPIGPDEQAEFESWLEGQYEWIPGSFESYTQPQPEDMDPLIDGAKSVQTTFGQSDGAIGNSDTSSISGAQSVMEEWSGHLSTNLQNNVLIPFPDIAANHGKIAEMMYNSMEAAKNIYNGQKRDISELADQTLAALKECGTYKPSELKMGLTIVGALAGIAGAALAIPSGGTSLAVTGVVLATISAGTSIGGEFVPEDENLALTAETVDGVISNMLDRMSDISTKRTEKEEDVTGVLEKNYDLLTSLRQLSNSTGETGPVIPLRPKLADADDPTTGIIPDDQV